MNPQHPPRFSIQHAITILRQGKTHALWREAAWHLIENAGKDAQLLLEAQRDLLKAAEPKPTFWSKYAMMIMCSLAVLVSIAVVVALVMSTGYCA